MKTAEIMILGICYAAFVAGCGGSAGTDGYSGERGQVSGKITVDGEPLMANCQVMFMANKGGFSASGLVREGGDYKLVYSKGKGLPVGDYQVQLTAPLAIVEAKAEAQSDPGKMGAMLKLSKDSTKTASDLEASRPFPLRYESIQTSGLVGTVISGQNEINFDLKKTKK